MSSENPVETKATKKAIKKQIKRLVRAHGPEKALTLVTELVAQATAGEDATAGKQAAAIKDA